MSSAEYCRSFCVLIARAATFSVFFHSGTQKLSDWSATLMLFENEYHVPVLPAPLSQLIWRRLELSGSILILMGLATRLSVRALLGMVLVIQTFIYPEAGPPTSIGWPSCSSSWPAALA